jgi:hypothetical protein
MSYPRCGRLHPLRLPISEHDQRLARCIGSRAVPPLRRLRVKNERNAVRANGVAAARCGRRVAGKSVPTSKRAADSAKRARRTTNRVAARRRLDNLRTSTWIVRRNLLPRRPHGQDAVPIPASRATPASERTARNATPSPGHASSPTPVSMPAGALSALRRVSAAISLNSSIRPCHFSRFAGEVGAKRRMRGEPGSLSQEVPSFAPAARPLPRAGEPNGMRHFALAN